MPSIEDEVLLLIKELKRLVRLLHRTIRTGSNQSLTVITNLFVRAYGIRTERCPASTVVLYETTKVSAANTNHFLLTCTNTCAYQYMHNLQHSCATELKIHKQHEKMLHVQLPTPLKAPLPSSERQRNGKLSALTESCFYLQHMTMLTSYF